jgi:hypothetical protein
VEEEQFRCLLALLEPYEGGRPYSHLQCDMTWGFYWEDQSGIPIRPDPCTNDRKDSSVKLGKGEDGKPTYLATTEDAMLLTIWGPAQLVARYRGAISLTNKKRVLWRRTDWGYLEGEFRHDMTMVVQSDAPWVQMMYEAFDELVSAWEVIHGLHRGQRKAG